MVIRMSENFVLFDSRMGDKVDWSDFFLKHLIDICKGEIEAKGNRPLGLFTSTRWKILYLSLQKELVTSEQRYS